MRIPLIPHDQALEHHQTRQFRQIFQAFGYPARIFQLDGEAMPAVLYCLCDADSPVALEGSWLNLTATLAARHVPLVGRENAAYIAADRAAFDWADLPQGNTLAPETGATLLLEARDLSSKTGEARLCATGAGIKDQAVLHLDADTAKTLSQRPAYAYPCGVDLIVTCSTRLVALPRHLHWEIS